MTDRPLLQHAREVATSTATGTLGTASVPFTTTAQDVLPAQGGYKYLRHASGPTGSSAVDMRTNSVSTHSYFEYEVPVGKVFYARRVNFILTDAGMSPGDFGGINGGLATGCSLQIIAADGVTSLLDFTDGEYILANDDFGPLAGSDVPVAALAGDDMLPIRFTISKGPGQPLKLTAGQRVRWTNRDNLGAMSKFAAMVQGKINNV